MFFWSDSAQRGYMLNEKVDSILEFMYNQKLCDSNKSIQILSEDAMQDFVYDYYVGDYIRGISDAVASIKRNLINGGR